MIPRHTLRDTAGIILPLHASDEECQTHRSQRVLQTHCLLFQPAYLFPPTTHDVGGEVKNNVKMDS